MFAFQHHSTVWGYGKFGRMWNQRVGVRLDVNVHCWGASELSFIPCAVSPGASRGENGVHEIIRKIFERRFDICRADSLAKLDRP